MIKSDEDSLGLESWSDNSDAVLIEDYFSTASLKNQLRQLKHSINEIILELNEPPVKPKDSLIEITHEGWVYRKYSSTHEWKKNYAFLIGDCLYFYKAPDRVQSKAELQISYWSYLNVDIEDELTKVQLRDGVSCSMRLLIFARDDALHLSFESQSDGEAWCQCLRRAMRRKYVKKEIKKKSELVSELLPKFQEQSELLETQFDMIVDALEKSGFWTAENNPKKLMEGYCKLQKSGTEEMKKMYVVLYKDFLYIFKPHDTVSMRTKPYTMINLKFITSIEEFEGEPNIFIITTPIRTFRLEAKHQVAVRDWIEKIELASNKKKGLKDTSPLNGRSTRYHGDDRGYRYDVELSTKLFKLISHTGKRRVYKFPKGQDFASIGRSSSSDITLKDDDYVSRNHCKIEISGNIPYLLDLGASTGTLLNDEPITMAPLKPGDLITIGQTTLEFQVKIAPHFFHMVEPTKKSRGKKKRQE